ncbi:Distal-less Dll limb-patterning protein [Operophtera brumata]|uniref:Distal-less Dll limb-patterning protein n=1 Tax=Operophtera brumata TaxID=104452 RepID=A0A0L7LM29_OPEBR|nr:Distal-less Dll limb-patterning protein [Operophtera brumata]
MSLVTLCFLVAGSPSGAIFTRIPQNLKITRIQSPSNKPSTLSFSDPFGPPSEGGGPSTPQPAMTSQEIDHHHHLGGSQTPHDQNSANSTPTNSSKSAFIELQQHGYGAFKGGYQHPHHFGSPGGQQNPHEASGFPSPRSLVPPIGATSPH